MIQESFADRTRSGACTVVREAASGITPVPGSSRRHRDPAVFDLDESRQLAHLVELRHPRVVLNTVNDIDRPIVHTVAQTLEHVRALDLHVLVVEGRRVRLA